MTHWGRLIARLVGLLVPAHRGTADKRRQVGIAIARLREQRKGVVLEGNARDPITDGRD